MRQKVGLLYVCVYMCVNMYVYFQCNITLFCFTFNL